MRRILFTIGLCFLICHLSPAQEIPNPIDASAMVKDGKVLIHWGGGDEFQKYRIDYYFTSSKSKTDVKTMIVDKVNGRRTSIDIGSGYDELHFTIQGVIKSVKNGRNAPVINSASAASVVHLVTQKNAQSIQSGSSNLTLNSFSSSNFPSLFAQFISDSIRIADIVFCMDNSGSMSDIQTDVVNNVREFVDSLVVKGIDMRLGLVRFGQNSNGEYGYNGSPIVEDNGVTSANVNYFKNTVLVRNVSSGSFEPGFHSLVAATQKFAFRPGVQKLFILITDEANDDGPSPYNYTLVPTVSYLAGGSTTVYGLVQSGFGNSSADYIVAGSVTQATGGRAFEIRKDIAPMQFDEAAALRDGTTRGITGPELIMYVEMRRKEFIQPSVRESAVPHPPLPSTSLGAITNGDFETGDFTGWSGSIMNNNMFPNCPIGNGLTAPVTVPLPLTERFEITSGTGFDPVIGSPLTEVAPSGGTHSCKLGKNVTGYRTERLEQSFTVTPQNANFKYQYTVILQDPDHPRCDNPFFLVAAFDANNNFIHGDTIYADRTNPFFQVKPDANSLGLCFRDWTSAQVDLSNFIGQNVRVEFTVADCAQSGHYGYAYIDNVGGSAVGGTNGSVAVDSVQVTAGGTFNVPLSSTIDLRKCNNLPLTVYGQYTLPLIGSTVGTLLDLTWSIHRSGDSIPINSGLVPNGNIDQNSHTFTVSLNATDLSLISPGQGFDFVVKARFQTLSFISREYTSTFGNGLFNGMNNDFTLTECAVGDCSAPGALRDDFNTPGYHKSLVGRFKWASIVNHPGNGTMALEDSIIEALNDNGKFNYGGVVWDSLMGGGTEASLTVIRKVGNFNLPTLFIYARMDSKDYLNATGYRLQFLEQAGQDRLEIQRVGSGYDISTALNSKDIEINPGDVLTFRVLCDNKTMVGLVNGTEVITAVDSTYKPSQWYFAIRSCVFGTPSADFDDFKVSSQPPGPPCQVISNFLRDDFNTPGYHVSLVGRLKWASIDNYPGNGTMALEDSIIEAINDYGQYNYGGNVWDSLMSAGTEASLTVVQKSGNFDRATLFIYARMASKDYYNGTGYRLGFFEQQGNDRLVIYRVGPGYTVSTALNSADVEINPGDVITFRVLCDNRTMVGLVNGTEVISATDEMYVPDKWYFAIRSCVFGSPSADFDDFKVSSYSIPTPNAGRLLRNNNDFIVRDYNLEQNYPNPFNPTTSFRFAISTLSDVKLEIFNPLGQRVAILVNTELESGFYDINWTANVGSGLYFYRLDASSKADGNKRFTQVRKMLLLK